MADDDPVSLQFLVTALRELGCEPTGVVDGSEARAACAQTSFDLMLLDRRMPDLGGAPLLRALRRLGHAATAIATSAELDSGMRAELDDAGYADAVAKPIGVEHLAALLSTHLPQWQPPLAGAAGTAPVPTADAMPLSPLLEDEEALASVGGDRRTLRALRGLFAKELETALPRITAMSADDLDNWLHRLRASCRYCGATRLLRTAESVELRIKQQDGRDEPGLDALIDAIAATISALDGT